MSTPRFIYAAYRVINAQGHSQLGFERLPAGDFATAHQLLERRTQSTVLGLYLLPVLLTPLADLIMACLRRRIPVQLLAEFFHNLGLMLRSGLAIDLALADLTEDNSHPGLKRLANDLLTCVQSGNSLTSGLALHEHQVPATVRHLVAIGEQSGNLDHVLMESAAHLNRMSGLKQDVSRALIYPAFVSVTIIGAGLFWVYYVLPDLADMFRQMGAQLPPLTQRVISGIHGFGEILADHGIWLLAAVLILPLLIMQSAACKAGLHWLAYRLPLSRTLVRTSSMAFISEYLALLVSAGISLLDCLVILEATTRNEVYRNALRTIRTGVQQGNSLSSELKRSKVFPPLMIRLVSVGEQSGNLDHQLRTLADEYSRRLGHMVSTLAEVIKPVILLLAGGLFVFVVVVFLLPVYDLIAQSTQLR